ncbi:MAG TPA: serine hydrolase domain-containing protein [Solirubrobacteraceae bacterium]|nr:serine hydrolase domain-containing protein [Solirubrobacteraceae bacterium]
MFTLRSFIAAAATAAALLLVPATAGAARPSPELGHALDRVVAAGAPGVVALAGGRSSAAGVADERTGRPLRAGDTVRIGSVTKSFTAVVALQLVGEGRLGLDDTVERGLPGVLPYGDRITLRHLLDHTSGVPDDVATPLMELYRGDPLRLWTPAETIALIRDQPPRFPAGTGWAYSNTDYVLAGLMIERATGHTLAHELERRIVRPLRLRDTSFPVRSSALGARGYSLELGPDGPIAGTRRDMTDYSPSFAWAGGNGVSTVRDVARFYRALLRGRLLAPRLLRQALAGVDTGKPGAATDSA